MSVCVCTHVQASSVSSITDSSVSLNIMTVVLNMGLCLHVLLTSSHIMYSASIMLVQQPGTHCLTVRAVKLLGWGSGNAIVGLDLALH